MVVQTLVNMLLYAAHVLQGLVDIISGKDESIRDADGKIVSKLPSKRSQVFVFLKQFLKQPVSVILSNSSTCL